MAQAILPRTFGARTRRGSARLIAGFAAATILGATGTAALAGSIEDEEFRQYFPR
ncbi:MAG TPA: hypothetical protein VMB26_07845 [Candidatus Binataceae bacterium]|nr:hypothetical protein [Candidatus Binataceae bacterium]